VRVNQLGYEIGTEARAYVMAPGAEDGATFTVRNAAGEAVVSEPLGAKLGAWGKFTVFALDFKVTAPGKYTISVGGPLPASSPLFRVDTPAKLYSQALTNSLRFYQAQRDGPDFIASALRTAPAHLNDKRATVYLTPNISSSERLEGDLKSTGAVIDASGGWFDAGDYLKFVETTSYVDALMLIGVRDFPNQMGAGASDFTAEARFGLDWLRKMWDDQSKTLYYQVGIGTGNGTTMSDHDPWRLPQVDDAFGGNDLKSRFIRHRPVFIAGPAGSPVSPNLAGRLAADFALCYRIFRANDPTYANQCLAAAEHIFDLANTTPKGQLLTAAPFSFYGESEWRDDLELGATELYFAVAAANNGAPAGLPHTDASFYLRAAAHWANAYLNTAKDTDTLNLYDVGSLAHFELYRAVSAAGQPNGLEVSQARLLAALKSQLDKAAAQAAKDPFGFGAPWNGGDSASHAGGLAVVAQAYAYLSHSSTHEQYSRRWAANMLGANAWGASLIVGDGSTFPNCIHHQIANLIGSQDGQPPILLGAVVEGPETHGVTGGPAGMRACPADGSDRFGELNGNGAVFLDRAQSYATVEPAIDLTATSFLMFAWRITGGSSGNP